MRWNIAMRPGQRAALDKTKPLGHVKVRYRGLKENTAQLTTLFALSNLWMVRSKLAVLDGPVRAQMA